MATDTDGVQLELAIIRDIIIKDPVALQKWALVVDHIVPTAVEERRVKNLLEKDRDYEEGILKSLQIWAACGEKRRADLLKVLRDYKLNSLADSIQQQVSGEPLEKPGLWFEVGEVVHNFTGREAELGELHKMLIEESDASSALCVISGLGGVGKSTLAKKYAFSQRKAFRGNALWFQADSVASIRASFARLAEEHLGYSIEGTISNEELAAKVYTRFTAMKCLFVFDNLEEWGHLREFQPKVANPDETKPTILITTRRSDLVPLPEKQLRLDVLTTAEAVALIERQLPSSSRNAARLAEKLHRLPLALQQAMAYIADTFLNDGEGIEKYLRQFEESEAELLDDERFKQDVDYSLTTLTTWKVTLKRIEGLEGGLPAVKLIQTLSYLRPDFITVDFLKQVVPEHEIGPSFRLLVKFSMISVHQGKVTIHRLVQHVIRLDCDPQDELGVLQSIAQFLDEEFLDRDEYTPLKSESVSHGLHLAPFVLKREEMMNQHTSYLFNICVHLMYYGNSLDGLRVAQEAAEVCAALKGPESSSAVEMKYRAAEALYKLRRFTEAREILDNILPISRLKVGETEWFTIDILALKAIIHCDLEEFAQAIYIYDEIIPLSERQGEDEFNVLCYKHSKASTMLDMGMLNEARALFQHVYEKRLEKYGKEDMRTMGPLVGLAQVALEKGKVKKALESMKEVYEVYKNVLGEQHPDTLQKQEEVVMLERKVAKKRRRRCVLA